MKIFNKFDLNSFKNLVERHAKFQKVMLLFDENVSNLQIEKLHSAIKEICIFNKTYLQNLDKKEIYNGYKMLIFVCSANSFLKTDLNLDEFVNIFLPINFEILPFFIDNNNKISPPNFGKEDEINIKNGICLAEENNFIFINPGIDIAIFYSYYFNNFFACLNNILSNENTPFDVNCRLDFITQKRMLQFLDVKFKFEDVEILKQLNLDYKFLPYLDYYLLLAIYLLISAIKQHKLSMVDVYKLANNNDNLIDEIYAKFNNCNFYQLLNLNYYNLKDLLNFSLKNMLKIDLPPITEQEKTFLLLQIKEFCKNSKTFFSYLYLFNIFGL